MKSHNTKLPFALREGPDCVVSNSYQVFEISNTEKLLPKYLLLWMNRSETQRFAGFISFGTTRDIFSFDDLGEVAIPIPSIPTLKDDDVENNTVVGIKDGSVEAVVWNEDIS